MRGLKCHFCDETDGLNSVFEGESYTYLCSVCWDIVREMAMDVVNERVQALEAKIAELDKRISMRDVYLR